MKTRTSKALGAAAGITAIALSLPLAITAYAEPPTEPTPVPVAEVPDPQGSGCDAFKQAVPTYKTTLPTQPVGQVIAGIPDISTFNSAISGGLNPAVNIVPVLDNGPYVVFAPTNEAFAKLPAGTVDTLVKPENKATLTKILTYHVVAGGWAEAVTAVGP